eukprot:2755447-Pleurochrysis_carterae.AAC.1
MVSGVWQGAGAGGEHVCGGFQVGSGNTLGRCESCREVADRRNGSGRDMGRLMHARDRIHTPRRA